MLHAIVLIFPHLCDPCILSPCNKSRCWCGQGECQQKIQNITTRTSPKHLIISSLKWKGTKYLCLCSSGWFSDRCWLGGAQGHLWCRRELQLPGVHCQVSSGPAQVDGAAHRGSAAATVPDTSRHRGEAQLMGTACSYSMSTQSLTWLHQMVTVLSRQVHNTASIWNRSEIGADADPRLG